MLNKSFFLGVLTTLLVVVVLAIGGAFAAGPLLLRANARFAPGDRAGRFEHPAQDNRQSPADNQTGKAEQPAGKNNPNNQSDKNSVVPDGRGNKQADGSGNRELLGRDRHSSRMAGYPVGFMGRGLVGILGGVLLVGVIIAAVVGGMKLFKGRGSQGGAPVPVVDYPVEPDDAPAEPIESDDAPVVETDDALVEADVEPVEPIEFGDAPVVEPDAAPVEAPVEPEESDPAPDTPVAD